MIERHIKFDSATEGMVPVAIEPSWILEGNPVTRVKLVSGSSDGLARTVIWDCTAGRFNWRYRCDETACVLEGSVVVRDEQGVAHTLSAGDTMFFPAGSSAHWTVDHYVRKVAILRDPLAPGLVLMARVHRKIKRIIGGKRQSAASLMDA